MKKYIIAAAIATMLASGNNMAAQSSSDKNVYTPQKGDWALGFDAIPVLRTIGGAFDPNDVSNDGIGATPMRYDNMLARPNVSVMAKYMFTDKWGLKVNLGITFAHDKERGYVEDDMGRYLNPNANTKVIDSRKSTKSGASLTIGGEYRVGQRRVQGVFGFGILTGFSTQVANYSYGNSITRLNRNPSTIIDQPATIPTGYRMTKERIDGSNFVVGAYASAGVECFVAPKVAIGASVDLYVYGGGSGKGYITSEGWNPAYQTITERTDLVSPGNSQARFGTDNIGGSLYMTFYF